MAKTGGERAFFLIFLRSPGKRAAFSGAFPFFLWIKNRAANPGSRQSALVPVGFFPGGRLGLFQQPAQGFRVPQGFHPGEGLFQPAVQGLEAFLPALAARFLCLGKDLVPQGRQLFQLRGALAGLPPDGQRL